MDDVTTGDYGDSGGGTPPPSSPSPAPAPTTPDTSLSDAARTADQNPGAPQNPTGVAGGAPGTGANEPTPTLIRPVRRGGLAGVVDEFADAVAGKTQATIATDEDGNAYVRHPQLSRGQQWFKIAAEALRGAAAGGAVGMGPGGVFKGANAGFEAADKQADQERKNEQQLQSEADKQNLEKFNAIKLKHDVAANEFQLQRAKVKATQDDIDFAQKQVDREKQLGSADLGVYKDEADLANVKKVNPDFWKDVHQNQIVSVPELDSNGNRVGIHLFLRTPGIGSQLVPSGTPIKVFTQGKTPNDPPTITEVTPTIPMTHDQVDTYNNAATAKMQGWMKDHTESLLQTANINDKTEDLNLKKSEETKNYAEANKIKNEAADTALMNSDDLADSIWKGQIVPEKMSILLAKPGSEKLLEKIQARAAAAGQTFDTSKLQAYPKLYIDYTSGKRSQQITNMNTAFQTLDDLKKANTWQSRNPLSKESSRFNTTLTTAAPEIANGLAKPGNAATKEEIEKVRSALSPNFNRGEAIDTQAKELVKQYVSMRNNWNEGAPSAAYQAKMPDIAPEARNVIRKYAASDPSLANQAETWWGKPVKVNGQLIGYTKDGVNLTDEKIRTQ